MRRESPCRVCGRPTRKFLLNESTLGIPMCSYGCEHKFLDSLGTKEGGDLLGCLDHRISETKHHLNLSWAIAGAGVLIILLGFLMKNATVSIVGASLASVCAFFTRYFEERKARLTRTKERIRV